jgi:hypothetical protein
VIIFRLIGVKFSEIADSFVENVSAPQVAAYRRGITRSGMSARETETAH